MFSKIQFPRKPRKPLPVTPAEKLKNSGYRLHAMLPAAGLSSNRPGTRENRLFKMFSLKMDAIRFISIASIVWGHTLFGWDAKIFDSPFATFVQQVFIQFGRIGTVSFFIISGFFLADKLFFSSVWGYLKYRWHSIILPWLIFIGIFTCIQIIQMHAQTAANSTQQNLILAVNLLRAAMFHAAFWFIPVSLISAIFLILLRQYINSPWFISSLLLITLFYSVNLYFSWISTNHERSFLAYTLFMWAGIWVRQNMAATKRVIYHSSMKILIACIIVFFVLSCCEGAYLKSVHCEDPYASIRFSNVILSCLLFIFFLKTKTIYRIKKLQPRKYVYGVYLIHSVILVSLMPVATALLNYTGLWGHMWYIIPFQIAAFLVVIATAYGMAVMLKNSKAHFLIGR